MTLGQKIKDARKSAGLTQAEFAALISNDEYKIGNTTVSNWEKDINKPDIEIISVICYKLNISASYFIEPKIPKNDENYGKNDNFKIDSNEIQHIQKYRILDEYGKKAIDALLKIEYERCIYSKGNQ